MLSLLILKLMSGVCSAQGLVTDIMREMENNANLGSDLTVKISVVQEQVRQGIRELEWLYYRRDSDDSFLLVFLSPGREKGNGYLRMQENMWMYRKNTRTFQHISRSDRIGNSLLNAEDLESKKLTQHYSPVTDSEGREIYQEEMLGKIPVYKFEVRAKVRDVSYHKHIYWVRKDNYLLLKQESYSLSGTLMLTIYFPKYTKIRDKFIPAKFLFVDEFEKGNRNIGTISGISLKDVDDTVFTKAYLENLSK